jgi:hypothetical protein
LGVGFHRQGAGATGLSLDIRLLCLFAFVINFDGITICPDITGKRAANSKRATAEYALVVIEQPVTFPKRKP